MMAEIATDHQQEDARTDLAIRNAGAAGLAAARDNPSICLEDGILDPDRPQFLASPMPAGYTSAGDTNGRGYKWASHFMHVTGFNTILAPNKAGCGMLDAAHSYIAPPSSYHPGGCHVLMADGAVIFITDSIESGDSRAGMVYINGVGAQKKGQRSPYGLWGSLGTRASKEVVDENL